MQYSKLNNLHIHLSDSESFSIKNDLIENVLKNDLEYMIGRSRYKQYGEEEISELVEEGRKRGIRIVPEIDTPAHTLSWKHNSRYKDVVICEDKDCPAPPCGMLDIDNQNTLKMVDQVFQFVQNLFPGDYFHIGCDEIQEDCLYNRIMQSKSRRQKKK